VHQPGWWPTKGTAEREEFIGKAQCARCHAEKTATQLTTPMAHAGMTAANSTILREHESITLKRGPYDYAIQRTSEGST